MSDRRESYVYVIFRQSGDPCYVGKGKGGRWRTHVTRSHNQRLSRIYAKAGGDLPILKIREGLTDAEACLVEVAFIAAIGRGKDGPLVNLTDGGEGSVGLIQTPETIEKRTAKLRGRKHSAQRRAKASEAIRLSRKLKPLPGVKWTDDRKLAAGAKLKGISPIAAIAASADMRRGKPLSAGHKKAVSDGLTGVAKSPEHVAAISAGKKGWRASDANRANMSASHVGKPLSVETRATMRVAQAVRRAREAASRMIALGNSEGFA